MCECGGSGEDRCFFSTVSQRSIIGKTPDEACFLDMIFLKIGQMHIMPSDPGCHEASHKQPGHMGQGEVRNEGHVFHGDHQLQGVFLVFFLWCFLFGLLLFVSLGFLI